MDFDLGKIARRVFGGQVEAVPESEPTLTKHVTDELIAQYEADRPGSSNLVLHLLAEYQADHFRRINPHFRKLSLALQNYNIVIVDDELSVRNETRAGLHSFRLADSTTSPANCVIGEYENAQSVLSDCLTSLVESQKYLFILDGNFPATPTEYSEKEYGCEIVLKAIEERKSDNISVIIRSGEANNPEFRKVLEQYPSVLGALHKTQQECLFQWALSLHPEIVQKLIDA